MAELHGPIRNGTDRHTQGPLTVLGPCTVPGPRTVPYEPSALTARKGYKERLAPLDTIDRVITAVINLSLLGNYLLHTRS